MVSKGAKHLLLLSRSGANNTRSTSLIKELQNGGVHVYAPKCDISDSQSLQMVIDHCMVNMPPIRGCIQAAMDIRVRKNIVVGNQARTNLKQDSLFENMTLDAWRASLQPKVTGTWNLHSQLPRDLDFFVIFSSVAGTIGSQGQANYAAGNAFQDELARHRLRQGERAISLNLSILEEEGYATENQELFAQWARKRTISMSQPEVFALLEHYCNKNAAIDPARSQLVLGLDLPADVSRRGEDLASWMNEPMFDSLHQMATSSSTDGNASGPSKDVNLYQQVHCAKSLSEAAEYLGTELLAKVSKILSLDLETFDKTRPLHTYGVDSLIAAELRNWFQKVLRVDVTVFEILGGATAATLIQAVAERIHR